ncbi:MAG: hypothetical protein MHM6MM_006901 [Cercozoa sp. M6MM]
MSCVAVGRTATQRECGCVLCNENADVTKTVFFYLQVHGNTPSRAVRQLDDVLQVGLPGHSLVEMFWI